MTDENTLSVGRRKTTPSSHIHNSYKEDLAHSPNSELFENVDLVRNTTFTSKLDKNNPLVTIRLRDSLFLSFYTQNEYLAHYLCPIPSELCCSHVWDYPNLIIVNGVKTGFTL
ncbi:hypothetical protein RF11_06839 [Thelohanellus kitauei]|uniref:Uncharacterized protein n=1 Tax=Thelohanellus kitauei TaxID=669202 RepID=A0A0C2MMD3_THEKT|nr:hypothetical protein RF11_06839 [Thelohanellus kitauei]